MNQWSCPNCSWSHSAHPKYGWSKTDDNAVAVHKEMLCPNRVRSNKKEPEDRGNGDRGAPKGDSPTGSPARG